MSMQANWPAQSMRMICGMCTYQKKPYHFSQSTNVKMHLCICAHQIAFELPLCTVSSRNISIAKNETLKKLLILLESELWRTKYA